MKEIYTNFQLQKNWETLENTGKWALEYWENTGNWQKKYWEILGWTPCQPVATLNGNFDPLKTSGTLRNRRPLGTVATLVVTLSNALAQWFPGFALGMFLW